MRVRDACGAALAVAALLSPISCLLSPVRTAPGVEGRVVDRETGQPLAGAIVVLSFDGSYNDVLPDRENLGHAEAITGADGRFAVESYVRGGLTLWPHFKTETRVVRVLHDGYRCAAPQTVVQKGGMRIALTPSLDLADRQDSCRPLAARADEAGAYMAAWRGLFPSGPTPEERDQQRQLARLLETRAAFGYGENCAGPIHDLALAPGGARAGLVTAGGEVHLLTLNADGIERDEVVARAADAPTRRLAWTSPDELVLWQPADSADRAASPSIFSRVAHEVVWRSGEAPPASMDRSGKRRSEPAAPLDPADLNDEADRLWLGRSFALERSPDPITGHSLDQLRITREDGTRYAIDLPGQACGGPRFGRPHYRIGAGGGTGLDLRWVDAGCHAVQIDLASGDWTRIDDSPEPAICRSQRQVPPTQLQTALRGWSGDLRDALEAAGADPSAAYSLRISPRGDTVVRARNFDGETVFVEMSPFPLTTPLRRIDVTTVGPATSGSRTTPSALPASMQPL